MSENNFEIDSQTFKNLVNKPNYTHFRIKQNQQHMHFLQTVTLLSTLTKTTFQTLLHKCSELPL